MIRVGLCGFGYWGPNLWRSLAADRSFEVVAIADLSADRRAVASRAAPLLAVMDDGHALMRRSDIDAVVIATPVATHHPLAARAIEAGKHVLLEKPLCANVEEARDLIARAERAGVALMVDHTYVFHPAVRKIAALQAEAALGQVSYYDSLRVNLGLFQPDVNVLWDLAPHDLAILDHLFDQVPIHVEATGYCHVNPTQPDIAYVTLHYPSKMIAHLNLSWMSPVKVRRIAIGGSRRMVVWDDLDYDQRIKVYDSGITVHPDDRREVLVPSYRIGDVHSPRLSDNEPLALVVAHFAAVIRGEVDSALDGSRGLRVLDLLERAQRELDRNVRAATAGACQQAPETAAAAP